MALAGAGLGHLGRLWQQSKCWKGTTAEGPEPGRGLGGNGAVELDRGVWLAWCAITPSLPGGCLPQAAAGAVIYLSHPTLALTGPPLGPCPWC